MDISNFLDIETDDLFPLGERISLSIILSIAERSGIKFKVTHSAGFLSHLNIDFTVYTTCDQYKRERWII